MGDLIPVSRDLTEFKWSPEETDLLNKTVAKGQHLTPPELLLFGYVCKQSGLDPFLQMIYPIKFNKGKDNESLVFVTGINGYRTIAESTGIYAGRDDITYDEGLTKFQMEAAGRTRPRSATCTVYKILAGIRNPTTVSVLWTEYFPKLYKNKQTFWNIMPFHKLGLTAESHALRVAFPKSYKGIYLEDEFDQSEARPAYQVTEETLDMIDDIEEIYKNILGYNPASIIAKNVEVTGESDLQRVPKEKLEILKYQLKILVEKNDELEGESQNVYQDVTEEK